MTGRQEAASRRQSVMVDLVAAIAAGTLKPGDPVAPLGTLGRQYGLSKPTVAKALEPLIQDGTLQMVPSVGLFVGHTPDSRSGCHVVLVESDRFELLRRHPTVQAFEERITELGASALVVGVDEFVAGADIPSLLGVFSFTGGRVGDVIDKVDSRVAVSEYLGGANPSGRKERASFVDVDNVAGGALATAELLRSGYRSVAFVGIHRRRQPALFSWSQQRAAGWAETLKRHAPRVTPLLVEPGTDASDPFVASAAAARAGAVDLLDVDACVAADDLVALALADEWRRRRIPRRDWPAMIGFEALGEAEELVISSVRPDWPGLGLAAANQLFDASRGRLRSPGQVERVPMKLIHRPVDRTPHPATTTRRHRIVARTPQEATR